MLLQSVCVSNNSMTISIFIHSSRHAPRADFARCFSIRMAKRDEPAQPEQKHPSTKRAKQDRPPKVEKAWSPPPGSWEHDVSYVDTVEEMRDPKTGKMGRFVYLVWNNQQKTQHPLKHVYQKCPQKVHSTRRCVIRTLR